MQVDTAKLSANECLAILNNRKNQQATEPNRTYTTEEAILISPYLYPIPKAPLVKEAFELMATGLYNRQELCRLMKRKGLNREKSTFPNMLKNPIYCGKILIHAWKKEPEQIIQGKHEAIVPLSLFNKVQEVLEGKSKTLKSVHFEKLTNEAPLRSALVCSQYGYPLTSSKSKGRSKYYNYYHCHQGSKERFPVEDVHENNGIAFDAVAD